MPPDKPFSSHLLITNPPFPTAERLLPQHSQVYSVLVLDAADNLIRLLLGPAHGLVKGLAEHPALHVFLHLHLVRRVHDPVPAQHLAWDAEGEP